MRIKSFHPQNAFAFLLIGILSRCVVGAFGAGAGADIAARHSVVIDSASRVVLGNGSVGWLAESASRTKTFMEGTLLGEHWFIREPIADATPAPAVRVPLCVVGLKLGSENAPEIAHSRLTSDATYQLWDGRLISTERTDEVLAATMTVSPTRDLVMGEAVFSIPCDATLEVRIPSEFDYPEISPAPRIVAPEPGVLTMTRSLPYGESYGLGLILRGDGQVRSTTTEWGGVLSLRETQSLAFALVVVHPEEGMSLEKRTDAETVGLSTREWRGILQEDRHWRAGFWDRAIVDTSGSSDPRANRFEKLGIALRHGFATHARGTFPPSDAGFWPSPVGGRVWHPLLWESFRGWILTGNEADIRWLSYPLSFSREEISLADAKEVEPLLPAESGPDGVASTDLAPLLRRFSDLVADTTPTLGAIEGLQYSAFAKLVDCLAGVGSNPEETDELFPYLKENALRAEKALAKAEGDPSKVGPLLIAIEAARRQAERIRVDARSQDRWRSVLEPYGLVGSGNVALESLPFGRSTFRTGPNDLDRLTQTRCAPDGLVQDSEGNPSIALTGAASSRLADCLIAEREGVLHILPDIPMDGSWSLEVKNVSVPGGFTLRTLAMRKGVVDSFLLRSNAGGPCRLKLPSGWTSARVLNVGDPQSPVTAEGKEVLTFGTQKGEEFLVAPVW